MGSMPWLIAHCLAPIAHGSKLSAHSSLLIAQRPLLTAQTSRHNARSTTLKAHSSQLKAQSSLLSAHSSQLNSHCSALTAQRSQLTAQRSLLSAHSSPPASTKQLKPAVSISKDVKCLVHVTVAEVDARAEALVRDVVMQDVVQICSGIVESAAEYIGRDVVAGVGGPVGGDPGEVAKGIVEAADPVGAAVDVEVGGVGSLIPRKLVARWQVVPAVGPQDHRLRPGLRQPAQERLRLAGRVGTGQRHIYGLDLCKRIRPYEVLDLGPRRIGFDQFIECHLDAPLQQFILEAFSHLLGHLIVQPCRHTEARESVSHRLAGHESASGA